MANYKFSIQADAMLSPASLSNIQAQLNALGKKAGVKIDFKGVDKVSNAIKGATKQSNIFGQSLGDVAKKIVSWTLLTGVIFGVIRALKNGVQAVVDLDTALVELRKVTNLSGSQLDTFVGQAQNVGDKVARTTEEVVKATASFARMGYSVAESLNLAEQASMLVNIGDGIDNIDDSTGALIATMKGFNLEATDAGAILDKLNEVSNNYAVDTSDLADGITRVSASLAAAGNSLDQTIAMITSATEVIRDSSRASVA